MDNLNDKKIEHGKIDGLTLNERSFYPPKDSRAYSSGVDDVDGGDSFNEYAIWFWDEYGYEIYDDIDM